MAQDPRIDTLRRKMNVLESPQYSADYLDPEKRSVPNAIQVHFNDPTSTPKVEVEYPMGHRKRRLEGFPALDKKFMRNLLTKFSANHAGDCLLAQEAPGRCHAFSLLRIQLRTKGREP